MKTPTPGGVPVRMTSPGSRVKNLVVMINRSGNNTQCSFLDGDDDDQLSRPSYLDKAFNYPPLSPVPSPLPSSPPSRVTLSTTRRVAPS